jgi:hypothetical protein
MEDPDLLAQGYFNFWREQQGWPMIPKEVLGAAGDLIKEAEAEGTQFTFCDVPIQHLTLEEARAALAMMYHHRFRLGGDIADMEAG